MNPLVSVIIPTYNRDLRFLKRAVDSVLAQTYPETEIVVVNDNKPDQPARQIVDEYMRALKAENDRVVYVLNEKNVGGSIARNNGIAAARGQYITFLDDDDRYLPEKVEHQVRYMVETDCDMSFEDSKAYSANDVMVDYREFTWIKAFDNETLLRAHLMKHIAPTATFMYKAEKLREIGGFEDAKMGQEFYLMLKTIERGLKIGYVHRSDIYVYRHTEGRISQGRNKVTGEAALYEFKKKYFPRLTKEERAYIAFRHWAIMAVAYKRDREFGRMLTSLAKSVCASPKDFWREGTAFFGSFLKNLGKTEA
ncbi:MAG: glycosyltransferase family 2 protein [Christensenellales bacterium]|jgi:glycosyltransferase involved in cell wall biosynthesis